ncbi:hypothetical protein QAD02_015385 [Eretmocerus hayati]|uniref:Uncharacterized protein n=2 Tax=Eretmocerus hayati TaxID=131215 RepID=A0ACC2P833_9HYME|nr:hypothetical protein QAD02_005157 [Eretmocerus hayati]KAJ8679598.1 hypothetical protein QAD02_015385 [Eretmocerus hayati]
MSCKFSTDREIATKIIQEYEKHPCLYDKKNESYRNESDRNTALKTIENNVNNGLNLRKPLEGEDIKKKWKNYRKTYRLNEEKKSKYYLGHLLTFLKPHLGLKCDTNEKSDDSKTSEHNDKPDRSENNEGPSVQADKNTNNETTDQGRKHKLKDVPNQEDLPGTSQKEMPEYEMVSPPPSDKYLRDKAKITKLEQDTMEVAGQAVKVMETVMSSSNKENESIFLNPMKQSLMDVPQEYLLECVNGVLVIIDMYIEDGEK